MKKQIRKAMICTIAMMLIGVVSLTGVTYAWFSQSTTAIVEGIDLGIVSKEGGVLISATCNPTEWAYRISLGLTEDNALKDFNPASTVPSNLITEGANAGRLQFFNGVINEAAPSQIYTEELPVAGTDGKYYIEKEIYFYNDDPENPITVKLDKTATTVTGTKNVGIAMRLAIVDHGDYVKGTADVSNVLTTESAKVKIFEFDPFGRVSGSTATTKEPTCGVIASSDEEYFVVADEIANVTDGIDSTVSDYLALAETVTPTDSNDITFQIAKGKCHKVTVYIWLEGQDPDCINTISGSKMDIQIGFTKVLQQQSEAS